MNWSINMENTTGDTFVEHEGPTDQIVDSSPVKEFTCSLCGCKSSQDIYLTNHFKFCNHVENPDERLDVDTSTLKNEVKTEEEELHDEHTIADPIFHIKMEKFEFTETTISQPSYHLKTETHEELLEYDHASSQSTQLEEHVTEHWEKKKYYCDTCNYATTQHGFLQAHKRRHTAKKSRELRMSELAGKQFKCSFCDYTSALNSNLTQHIRTHTGEKQFKCSYCDYASTQQAPLIYHTRMHTGEKPIKCDLCDYACTLRGYLAVHMRSKHTREKPYKCMLCEYACKHRTHLTYHMKSKHTSQFECSMCNYSAIEHSDLKKHMKIHKGDKPFKCKLCAYTCAQRGYLIRHMRINHTEEQLLE